MSMPTKKRVQVQIDTNLVQKADSVFDALGINATTAIVALYKRVAAQGGLPFDLQLTPTEQANNRLQLALKSLPSQALDTDQEIEAWFNNGE
jgi:DNA-damage-inducible protein J